ncbi:MAG: hypothetical protein GX345_01555 [Clostridiales bacterium]|nr:hypothetical protein [Clostridiales bacterium]
MKNSSKTALGGIIAALSLTLLFSVSIVPFFTYALPAAAATLLIPLVIEVNKRWALGVYAGVSLLSFFIVPDKEVAVMYAAFFGYYVILKFSLESKFNKVISWLFKCALFNISALISYFLMIRFMGIELDELEKFGMVAIPILLALGTFAFVLYDIALTRVIYYYLARWRKHILKLIKF